MSATFNCPHCDKEYPNKASLIGRKVRCSKCKDVFQLQGDGTAVKIELIVKRPEAPQQAAAEAANTSRTTALAQELTRRQKQQVKKGITKRLEKNRNALRDAAMEAVAQVGEEQERAKVERKKESSSRLPSSVKVHLSGPVQKSTGRPMVLLLSTLLVLAVLVGLLLAEDTPQRIALDAFAQTIEDEYYAYPLRMDGYRKRMWLYSRDGVALPPLIVNADSATFDEPVEVKWSDLVAVSQKHLGGMSLMRQFAIWVSSDKQAMVEQLWAEYQQKHVFSSFLALLKQRNINYMHCSEYPKILADNGFSDLSIYVASLLLAGTSDASGTECRDYGLISSLTADNAEFHLLHGKRSMELIEKGNEYSIAMSGAFSGIVVGFTGIVGEPDEWRVLDLRFGDDMRAFFGEKHNPLIALTLRAHQNFQKAYADADDNSTNAEEDTDIFDSGGFGQGGGQP